MGILDKVKSMVSMSTNVDHSYLYRASLVYMDKVFPDGKYGFQTKILGSQTIDPIEKQMPASVLIALVALQEEMGIYITAIEKANLSAQQLANLLYVVALDTSKPTPVSDAVRAIVEANKQIDKIVNTAKKEAA